MGPAAVEASEGGAAALHREGLRAGVTPPGEGGLQARAWVVTAISQATLCARKQMKGAMLPQKAALGPPLPAVGSAPAWSSAGLGPHAALRPQHHSLLSTITDSFIYSAIRGAPTTPSCMVCAFPWGRSPKR